MRVLLVNTNHFRGGGDSTYTFNLAELLRDNGDEVAFFAMQDERNQPDPNSDLFVSHIDFKELNRRKGPITGLRILGRVIYSREARAKFSRILERVRPNVVHLQNIHSHITPSVIFEAQKHRLPVVWTLHDYRQICPNSNLLIDQTGEICEACGTGAYYHAVLKRCKKGSMLASGMAALEAYAHRRMRVRERVDAFLTPSAFLNGKLVERGFPPPKVHHLPLFVPDTAFRLSEDHRGYFLFLGNLLLGKGIRPLLEACRLLPEIRLKLAGRVDGPLARELPVLLPPNAQYVGLQHGRELQSLLHNALALVLPALWFENQPFSILEAFACGKPVVASDLGGMRELVADGERGFLARPGDVRSLADAMNWLATHPEQAKDMGRAAYEYASREHSAARHYQRLSQIYRDCISAVPAAGGVSRSG